MQDSIPSPREVLVESLAQDVEVAHTTHVFSYAINRAKTYGWKFPAGTTGQEDEPESLKVCLQASDAFDAILRERLQNAFDAGKAAATQCPVQIQEPAADQKLASDRDSHFFLAGWNGSRREVDANEHFKEASKTAPVLAALPAQQERKYRQLERGEAMLEGDQFMDDDTVTWHPIQKGFVKAGACWGAGYQPMRREITDFD